MSEEHPILYCATHPQVETTLRCNRCEKPICTKCALLTPTGYRCQDCVRNQQKTFETAQWYDYLLAISISGILSFIGSQIVPALGFFTIFLAPVAGVIIAEITRRAIQRRRAKRLYQAITAAVAIGSMPPLLLAILTAVTFASQGGLGLLWSIGWHGLYTFTVTSTVYYRMSGISIGR